MNYVCQNCNTVYSKWIRICKNCNESRSIKESTQTFVNATNSMILNTKPSEPLVVNLSHITNLTVLKRNSIYVLGGEPGIGKSTLVAQICLATQHKILYCTGEESTDSVNERILRINKNIIIDNLNIYYCIYLEDIRTLLTATKYDILIIDSMHTLKSMKQTGVLYVCDELRNIAIEFNIGIILTSHITKEGIIAGPKTIEHMVDVVFYLEGDRYNTIRTLRSVKNRFGSTSDYSIFEMTKEGLIPINDFERFIYKRNKNVYGAILCPVLVNGQIIIIEVQALVIKDALPRVESCGYNLNKIRMLIGVLFKWCKINLQFHTIYINVISGIKIEECSIELAICAAILSSYYSVSISTNILFCGEISLTGDIILNNHVARLGNHIPNNYIVITNLNNNCNNKQVQLITHIEQLYNLLIQNKS